MVDDFIERVVKIRKILFASIQRRIYQNLWKFTDKCLNDPIMRCCIRMNDYLRILQMAQNRKPQVMDCGDISRYN